MKMSSRERNLLCIVVSVALGVLYYNFVFTKNSAKLEEKKTERKQVEQKYEDAKAEIADIDNRRTRLSELKAKGEELAKDYYPEIIQENLIKEIKTLMDKNGLKGDYSWAERNADQLVDLTPEILDLPKSSVQALADIVKSQIGEDSSDKKDTQSSEVVSNNKETETSTAVAETGTATAETSTANTTTTQNSNNSNGEQNGPTPVKMVLTIKLRGNYDSLRNFVQDIKDYGRVVAASALSTDWSSANDFEGQIDVEFYAIPKINDKDDEYLDWK